MKIDVHTHILPKRVPRFAERFGYGGFIEVQHKAGCNARMVYDDGRFFREVGDNCWDPKRRVEECDAQGVATQVLSTVPVMFNYWAKGRDTLEVARFLNDHLAGVVAQHPKRFLGLATVPLQDAELATLELQRVVKDLKLSGVQIGTHFNGRSLDDASLFPFYAEAERLGAALFVHPWEMLGKERMDRYWLPWLIGMPTETALAIAHFIFGGVFEKFPKLRVAFAHGGGSFASVYGRMEHGFSARPDLVATQNPVNPKKYLGHFFVDSIVHAPDLLRHCLKVFGADKILLGSDYPFPLGELRPGEMIQSMSDLSEVEKTGMLAGNARVWLGLP
ncbi:MAG: amidohydrolase [Deltaproteobacteria bacterium]|nr:amidohydrolase [Deltaproteobacteria bacterium]MBI3295763.1 amidohydrolase [Deltaproteobacteria bacterium]